MEATLEIDQELPIGAYDKIPHLGLQFAIRGPACDRCSKIDQLSSWWPESPLKIKLGVGKQCESWIAEGKRLIEEHDKMLSLPQNPIRQWTKNFRKRNQKEPTIQEKTEFLAKFEEEKKQFKK